MDHVLNRISHDRWGSHHAYHNQKWLPEADHHVNIITIVIDFRLLTSTRRSSLVSIGRLSPVKDEGSSDPTISEASFLWSPYTTNIWIIIARVGEVTNITSYFYKEVIYYSYILLYQKSNFVILLVTFKSNIICNLVTSYWVTLKVYWACICRTLFLLRKLNFYEEYSYRK